MQSSKRIMCGLALAALGLGAGCGASVVEAEGVGGSGGNGTGTVTGSGVGGTGGVGAGGTGGVGGYDTCAAYQDEQSSSAMTIRFVNESGLPIYLPAHCGVIRYDLVALSGDDARYAYDPFCLQTCEDLQSEGIIDCANCAPTTVLLPAGTTLDWAWDGTGLLSTDMPDSCWFMPGQQNGCSQQVAAAPGSFRASALGYESCGNGDCQCDASGVCNGEAMGMEAYSDTVTFQYPSPSVVEVIFGVCAFPCPS